MVELTASQIDAIGAQKPTPLHMVNPETREVFVLIRKDVYDLTCGIVASQGWDDADDDLIADQLSARKRA